MNGMRFGYARVSTQEQNLDLQIDALQKVGISEDNIFMDKISTRKKDGPQFKELMKMLRPGDSLTIWKLDRAGRDLKHLIELVEILNSKGVDFISLKENIDTTTAVGKLTFHIFASLAQFERDIISERTKAGLEAARARGRHGGRPRKDESKVNLALKMYDSKQYTVSEIEEATGVSKATLYRRLRKRENKEPEVKQNGNSI